MGLPGGFARRLLDEFSLSVAVLDGDGRIVWVNRAWRESEEERRPGTGGVGTNYLDATASATDDPYGRRAEAGLAGVLGGDRSGFTFEYPCHGERELRWYSMRATTVEFDDRRYCLVAHEDVTDRKVSELVTRARRDEAATLNRMFTHELRNAVGSAAGWLDMLDTEADQTGGIERIAAALDRIERAVGDSSRLLDLTHESRTFERVDVVGLAEAAWKRRDRGDVSLEFADRFPLVCYPWRTQRLLESLFDSAAAGSSVTVVRIRLGTREFYVEDDRSEPVPPNPELAFAETPVGRDGRLSTGLSLSRPLALMNGWELSLEPSPLGGWQFTVRTEQLHV